MNFCPKCGGQLNAENLQFCPICGAVLAPQGQPQPSASNQAPPYGAPRASAAVRTLKSLGSSGLYLTAIISFTLVALLTLISAFMSPMSLVNTIIGAIANASGMGGYELAEVYDIIGDYLGVIKTFNIISTVFSLIPTAIVAIGLWLIYATSRKPEYERFSTAGFTTIKVMNIISLIGACLTSIIVFFIMLAGTIAAAASGPEELALVFGIGMIVTLIVSVVVIIYYCKIIKSLNMATRSVRDNIPYPNASRFVGIMCFVGAAGSLFGMITLSVIGFIQAILSVVQMIIFGILIFKYRSEMSVAAYENQILNQQY